MFDDTLRAGLAVLFAALAAGASGCDPRAAIHATASAADALGDAGKVIWPLSQASADRTPITPVESAGASQ